MIGYTCKYTPIELFQGFGESCEILNNEVEQLDYAQSEMHTNVCCHTKAVLEQIHCGGAEKVVLMNCCDSTRRLFDVLKNEKLDFCQMLDIPTASGCCAVEKLKDDLLALIDDYKGFSGIEFNKSKFLASFNEKNDLPEGKYIALLGARSNEALHNVLKKSFNAPIVDLTCAGNRNVRSVDCTEHDSLDKIMLEYAKSLFGQIPCMRMNDTKSRNQLIDTENCIGIIYHTVKFCDFYDFEYSKLKMSSIPILKIETDFTKQSYGQLLTRAEGFSESIEKKNGEKTMIEFNESGRYYAGIDSGSTSTELVLLDEKKNIIKQVMVRTGANASAGTQKAIDTAGVKLQDIKFITATGYGRKNISFANDNVTEITCHAKGAKHLFNDVRTIIDIGGQDSKVIYLDENGNITNFLMNDKCAAGTGRFLENMAKVLEISLSEMATTGLTYKKDITISSMCTVFAESEIVSLIAENETIEDIVHGLNKSIALKTKSLARSIQQDGRVVMTGGVANNKGVVKELEKSLETTVSLPEKPEFCGALGAALLAYETANK